MRNIDINERLARHTAEQLLTGFQKQDHGSILSILSLYSGRPGVHWPLSLLWGPEYDTPAHRLLNKIQEAAKAVQNEGSSREILNRPHLVKLRASVCSILECRI